METAEKNVYWSQWAIFSRPTQKERYSRHKAWHQLLCVIYYSMCGPRADSCVDIALLGTSLQEDVNCIPCLHLGPIPHAPRFPVSTLAWHCYCCLFPAATVLAGDVSILWVCVCVIMTKCTGDAYFLGTYHKSILSSLLCVYLSVCGQILLSTKASPPCKMPLQVCSSSQDEGQLKY